MNRQIKFRVWDIARKTMTYPEDKEHNYSAETQPDNGGLGYYLLTQKGILQCNDGVELDDWHDGFIVTQFISLSDKNGREIYEGDVVEYVGKEDPSEKYKGVVEYINGLLSPFYSTHPEDPTCMQKEFDFRVIGNIYENPELLKVETKFLKNRRF